MDINGKVQPFRPNAQAETANESAFVYFFRHHKLGAVFMTPAINSDDALLKCLRETHWPMEQLVYEGKDTVSLGLLARLKRQ